VPVSATSAEPAAIVPAPISAVWIAMLAHCAGSSTSSQSGRAPGMAAAVPSIAASPATTTIAIHQPLSAALRANSFPRAAKLTLAATKARLMATGWGSDGIPCIRAASTRQIAASKAISTPIRKRPAAAEVIIPAPISPSASIGPATSTHGVRDGDPSSACIASSGATSEASAAISQGMKEMDGLGAFAMRVMRSTLIQPGRNVEACADGRAILSDAAQAKHHRTSSLWPMPIGGGTMSSDCPKRDPGPSRWIAGARRI